MISSKRALTRALEPGSKETSTLFLRSCSSARYLLLSHLPRAHVLEHGLERPAGLIIHLDAHQHAPQLQGKIFQMLHFLPLIERFA